MADKYDIMIGIVKENSRLLLELNREVGEIKTELKSNHREKAKGYTKIGLFISSGVLVGKLVDLALGVV